MKFVRDESLHTSYKQYPFPHTIIDNFLHDSVLSDILKEVQSLKETHADQAFVDPTSPFNYEKYGFNKSCSHLLQELFKELNSIEFVERVESLTGIRDLIKEDLNLLGAGIHRVKNNGFLHLHTDYNSYVKDNVKLDRRINLILYLNPEWKDEYNGHLCLCDKLEKKCIKKIAPILNRCVIFNTSNKSIHGHPIPLSLPEGVSRQSVAVYYYTKNTNGETDFEGDTPHCTLWYPDIDTTKCEEFVR